MTNPAIVGGPPCASDDLVIDARLDAPPDPLIPDDKRRFARILRHRLIKESFFDLYTPTSRLEENQSPNVRNNPVRRYISYGGLVVDDVNIPVVVKCMSTASTASTKASDDESGQNPWDLERESIDTSKYGTGER